MLKVNEIREDEKECVEMCVILFKNWKWVVKQLYQTRQICQKLHQKSILAQTEPLLSCPFQTNKR